MLNSTGTICRFVWTVMEFVSDVGGMTAPPVGRGMFVDETRYS